MQADNRFIIQKTNWRPQINLDEGLKISIKWYKNLFKFILKIKMLFEEL